MDKVNQKNIDIHLSEKVLTEFSEIMKNLKVLPGEQVGLEQVNLEQTDTESHDSAKQNSADAKDAKAKAKLASEMPKDHVLKEKHQGKSYENLMTNGHKNEVQNKEADLLAILSEVESQNEPQKMAFVLNPSPNLNNEIEDRELELALEEEELEDEESSEDQEQSEEQDEEEISVESVKTKQKNVNILIKN